MPPILPEGRQKPCLTPYSMTPPQELDAQSGLLTLLPPPGRLPVLRQWHLSLRPLHGYRGSPEFSSVFPRRQSRRHFHADTHAVHLWLKYIPKASRCQVCPFPSRLLCFSCHAERNLSAGGAELVFLIHDRPMVSALCRRPIPAHPIQGSGGRNSSSR